MTRDETQEKLWMITDKHNVVNKARGFKAATEVRIDFFWDLVRMIETLLRSQDGQRQTDLGQERDQGASEPGDQK